MSDTVSAAGKDSELGQEEVYGSDDIDPGGEGDGSSFVDR